MGTAEQKGARQKIFFFLEKSTLSAYCADMAACGLSEAIQSLPPELREMILKEYIAIKIKEKKKEMGWAKVHENILKLPFCKYRRQIVPMVICFEYADCFFEGCCFPCFERDGKLHKASLSRPMELIEASLEHKNFLKECSWDGYDWHEWFLFGWES